MTNDLNLHLFESSGEITASTISKVAGDGYSQTRVAFLAGLLAEWTFGDSKAPGVKARKKAAHDQLTEIAASTIDQATRLVPTDEGGSS